MDPWWSYSIASQGFSLFFFFCQCFLCFALMLILIDPLCKVYVYICLVKDVDININIRYFIDNSSLFFTFYSLLTLQWQIFFSCQAIMNDAHCLITYERQLLHDILNCVAVSVSTFFRSIISVYNVEKKRGKNEYIND